MVAALVRRVPAPLVTKARVALSGPHRYRTLLLVGSESALLVAGLVAGVLLDRPPPSTPDQVATHVQVCDFAGPGAAAVTFDVSNGDRAEHSYQVHLLVLGGAKTLGSGT